MMDHRNEPDNSDRDHQPAPSERSESLPNDDDGLTGSYYYDDSTGYEVYDDDDIEPEDE